MKEYPHIPKFLMILVLVFSTSMLVAQRPSGKQIDKELKSVMKELPEDMRIQVLEYAQRKLAVKARLAEQAAEEAAKLAEAKKTVNETPAQKVQPVQAKAKPVATPQPKEAAKGQAIELKQKSPSSASVSAPRGPQAPAKPKPSYLEEAQSLPATKIAWDGTTYDFGTRKTGEIIKHTYTFKNTGDKPLKLTRVKASCGCTTPNYTREEIAPGEEGFIDVSFNSKGKSGPQTKTITVTGNFLPNNMVLKLRGTLEKPAASE
ncbi:MAG: DUF1573 domain-containing protein [Bacteroidota bacterium]